MPDENEKDTKLRFVCTNCEEGVVLATYETISSKQCPECQSKSDFEHMPK